VGLGNKGNGGRANRLWRGRRRRRWFAAVQAQPAPAPPLPPNPPLGFGPLVGEPFDSFSPPAGGFGPLDGETFDTQAGGFGPIGSESYDLPPGFGPLLGDIYETSAGKGFGPLDANELYAQETVAFSQPARSLVPGRAYTRSSPTTPRQLQAVPTLSLTAASGSYQLASLPTTDGDTLFTSIELECTAGVGVTVDAVVRVTDQDGLVMIPPTTLTNFRLAGDVFSLLARGLTRVLAQNLVSGAVLLLVVDTPATGTTLTATARVVGFPVA
jgi:hypothetical protein